METKKNLEQYQSKLVQLAEFLQAHWNVINVCMVDFITRDVFATVLCESDRRELAALSENDLKNLPADFVQGQIQDGQTHRPTATNDGNKKLPKFIANIQAHTLESLGVIEDGDTYLRSLGLGDKDNASLFEHFDRIMGDKKMHEVRRLSHVIGQLSQNLDIQNLADIGSGKGYLSSILAAFYEFQILAIDAKAGNTSGAEKRDRNLERKWDALLRRAKIRSEGEAPPMRSKRWKKHLLKNGQTVVDHTPRSVDQEPEKPPNLHHVTQFVDTTTDLSKLFAEKFGDSLSSSSLGSEFGIIGLHTCGGLASHSLRVFVANEDCPLLVNVGCCYHHLDEEFYRNEHLTDEENDGCHRNATFPLSSVLRSMKFQLGRNARMVAAQPMDRMASHRELPTCSLLWRAVLQSLLLESHPNLGFQDQQVGRIAKKSKTFPHYARAAWDKLALGPFKWTDEEMEKIFEAEQRKFGQGLNAFYQYRSLFAPLIEGLILLDRLVFLLEQPDVAEASLVKLFDPVISPRCFALIAKKNANNKQKQI